jgi:hypothetical protein
MPVLFQNQPLTFGDGAVLTIDVLINDGRYDGECGGALSCGFCVVNAPLQDPLQERRQAFDGVNSLHVV